MKQGARIRRLTVRSSFFLGGLTLLALGIVMTIQAGLGVSSWDVLHLGLANVSGLSVGTWSVLVGFVIIALTIVVDKRFPGFGCFVNMIYVGACIDFMLFVGWVPALEHWLLKTLLLCTGIVVMGIGSGMYIAADFGSGPRDGLTLALSARTGWSVRKVRITMEITVLVVGWLLGGPVFIGTLFAALTFGPILQFSLNVFKKVVKRLSGGGYSVENLNKRALRVNHHDGVGQQLR